MRTQTEIANDLKPLREQRTLLDNQIQRLEKEMAEVEAVERVKSADYAKQMAEKFNRQRSTSRSPFSRS